MTTIVHKITSIHNATGHERDESSRAVSAMIQIHEKQPIGSILGLYGDNGK